MARLVAALARTRRGCARWCRTVAGRSPAVILAVLTLVGAGAGCATNPGTEVAADHTSATTASRPGTTTAARSPGCEADRAPAAPRGTDVRVEVPSGSGTRWYTRFIPSTYDGEPAPLVIDLHGYLSGAAGEAAMSNFTAVAQRESFVLATPQGNSDKPYWNAVPHPELPDDLAFIAAIIDDVNEDLCLDPARVYVTGFSNGAFLASLVACKLADRVAAVAPVAGLLLPEGCAPSRPVPILSVHGTEDRYVSFRGEPNPGLAELPWNDESRAAFAGLPFADVAVTAANWAALEGCAPAPTRTKVGPSVELTVFTDCPSGSTVQLYVVNGGGHTWPGSKFSAASEAILGKTTTEIDATELIWSYFEAHAL